MISVIIPAHNEAAYIEQYMQSIISQKEKYDEIIVVCDACTDNTNVKTKKYTNKILTINAQNVSFATKKERQTRVPYKYRHKNIFAKI